MTNWLPDLSQGVGPRYLRLAEQIEHDIETGTLPEGAKLPPQRNLAFDIGVTVGTVSRAYALVRERGLVSGEVGRGTYVLGSADQGAAKETPLPAGFAGTRSAVVQPGKLRMETTAAPDVGQAKVLEELMRRLVKSHPDEIASYTRTLPERWLEAGKMWLRSGDWAPEPQTIVPTLGGHAAILAAIAAVTAPGDRVAYEQLTYSSIARSGTIIGRRAIPVAIDAEGMNPEDFERVCAQQHPKIVFLVAALHNPTLAIMSEARRRAIVEVARRYNVWLVEDNIYGSLLDDPPVALAALAPERTFHVGSQSKSVAAGIRGGWVSCPAHLAPRVLTAHKMISGGMPFLLAELAAQLVLTGAAHDIRGKVLDEIGHRHALAQQTFEGLDFASHRCAPFLWMKLPEPWLSGTFKNAASDEGVLIDDEDEFKVGQSARAEHRIRIAFSAPKSRADVQEGFETIRRLLDNAISGYDSYS